MPKQTRPSPKWIALAVVALGAAACLPQGFRLPQSSLLSSFERQSGRIAYIGSDGNVQIIDQGARHAVALTSDALGIPDAAGRTVYYDYPTWSPIDRRVAFRRVMSVQGGSLTSSILVASEDGGDPIEVYRSGTDAPIYLYWSPDGERIGFLTGGLAGRPLALRVARADGEETAVIDSGRPYYWAWSPADSSIFAHVGGTASSDPAQARLSLLGLNESITEIGMDLEPGLFQAPSYSPDGQSLLFATHLDSGVGELMLTNASGEGRTVVAEFPGAVAFAWAPRGHKVAYIASGAAGERLPGDLFFLDLEDPEHPVQIKTEAEEVVAFFWAPDGERVAYLVPVVITVPGTEAPAQVSIDEILLALYVAESSDGTTKFLGNFRPSQATLGILPFFDQYQRSATIWSPDGNYLVISALYGADAEVLFLVPSSGNIEPRYLVDGGQAFWSWK
ncbi:MAG: hypothetical protein WD040_02225 [Anaerolineales bacterium]